MSPSRPTEIVASTRPSSITTRIKTKAPFPLEADNAVYEIIFHYNKD